MEGERGEDGVDGERNWEWERSERSEARRMGEEWDGKVIGVVWWESYTPPAVKIEHLFHNPAPSKHRLTSQIMSVIGRGKRLFTYRNSRILKMSSLLYMTHQ